MATSFGPVGSIILIVLAIFVIVGGFWLFLLDDILDWMHPERVEARFLKRLQNCEDNGTDCIGYIPSAAPPYQDNSLDSTRRL